MFTTSFALLASIQLAGAASSVGLSKGMPSGWDRQQIADGQKANLTCVCATERGRDDVVLAGGPEGLILRADAKGWVKEEEVPTTWDITALWPSKDGTVWAVAQSPRGHSLLLRRDPGISGKWSRAEAFPDDKYQVTGVWSSPEGNIWVAGIGAPAIYRRTDKGWAGANSPSASGDLHSVNGCGSNVWAVGKAGRAIRWQGGVGSSLSAGWSVVEVSSKSGNAVDLLDIRCFGEKVAVAAGDGALFWWRGVRLDEDSSAPLGGARAESIAGTPADLWVVGSKGTILNSVGGKWTKPAVKVEADLHGAWKRGPDLWIVGDAGTIVHHRIERR